MSAKKIERRSRVKTFVKVVNYNHLMPTRYLVAQDIDLKNVVTDDKLGNKDTKKQMKREVKKLFQEKYVLPIFNNFINFLFRYNNPVKSEKGSHVAFFFKKLRF
jgi:large subunit ribosomal protein L27e